MLKSFRSAELGGGDHNGSWIFIADPGTESAGLWNLCHTGGWVRKQGREMNPADATGLKGSWHFEVEESAGTAIPEFVSSSQFGLKEILNFFFFKPYS